ncbi:hypothetical protein GCM10027074_35740 [Streptomyces deserti]
MTPAGSPKPPLRFRYGYGESIGVTLPITAAVILGGLGFPVLFGERGQTSLPGQPSSRAPMTAVCRV